jgi:hypothetical protein
MDKLEALLIAWNNVQVEIQGAQQRQHEIRQEIEQYMDQEGAEERQVNGQTVTYKPSPQWFKELLRPLLEQVPYDELISSGAYIPETTKVIPPDWDMRKVKPLARYSGEARRIIENANRSQGKVLKITEKKGE